MEITKIRKREDLKNLTDVAKVFYNEEIVPCAKEFEEYAGVPSFYSNELPYALSGQPTLNLPLGHVFRAVSIVTDYEHNAVFLKTEPGFTNQELLKKRPDLFTNAHPVNGSLIEDITFDVLNSYLKGVLGVGSGTLSRLETSIYAWVCGGQISYLRQHGGAFIESCDEISVTDLKDVANDIFKVYVHDGKFMLNEMNDQCYIYIELIYGNIFTSESGSEAVDEDDTWNLTEAFRACVLLENKSDCTREDIERYILTAARAAMGWYLE